MVNVVCSGDAVLGVVNARLSLGLSRLLIENEDLLYCACPEHMQPSTSKRPGSAIDLSAPQSNRVTLITLGRGSGRESEQSSRGAGCAGVELRRGSRGSMQQRSVEADVHVATE